MNIYIYIYRYMIRKKLLQIIYNNKFGIKNIQSKNKLIRELEDLVGSTIKKKKNNNLNNLSPKMNLNKIDLKGHIDRF